MRSLSYLILFAFTACCSVAVAQETTTETPAALNFTMTNIDGQEKALADYHGKVILVVNVASRCGMTPQYTQLQTLHESYAEKGLAVLGFPCNQFGKQEPGTEEEIKTFCVENYDVSFDMFSKVDVNGDNSCDFYKHLQSLQTAPKEAGKISWNFEKFLIDRQGKVIARFGSRTKPDDETVVAAIEKALEQK